MIPHVFPIQENTIFKAFLYASLVVGISSALIMEYRAVDPFHTYQKAGDGDPRPISWRSILETSIVSTMSTFVVLYVLYFLFGLGQSFVLSTAAPTAPS